MKKSPLKKGIRTLSYLVDACGHVASSSPSNLSTHPNRPLWWTLTNSEIETACKTSFLKFIESGSDRFDTDLPTADPLSWSCLRIERQSSEAGDSDTYKITVKINSPKKENRDYRRHYKNLLQKMNLILSSSQQICWDWELESDTMNLIGPQDCILGYHYPEIAQGSQFWIERIHPEDAEKTQLSLQKMISGSQDIWDAEYRCRTANGEYLWVKQFGVVTKRNEKGTALNILGSTQLIEDRKKAENEKLQLLERYRAIAEAQGDAVVRINADQQITYYNSTFAKHFLQTKESELKLTLTDAIQRSPCLAELEAILHQNDQQIPKFSFISTSKRHDRPTLRFLWQATLLADKGLQTREIQFSGRDVSTLQSLEEALVNSNRENQAKDRFLAMISHDLKTPLNPILGFSEILMGRTHADESVASIAQSINAAGNQLHEHINSLLEISKMDPEIYNRKSDSVTLEELRSDFESIFALKAEKKGITFLTSLSGPRSETFALDYKLLQNVLNNLIDNAIKFTKEGKVLLMLSLTPATPADPQYQLQFKVVDDGIGIPEEHIEQIFEPFVRVDSSNSREIEGAGLGLSICQRALDILGGQIETIRNPDRGMTFSGSIPVHSPLPKHPHLALSSDASFNPPTNTRTLIIDDIKSNRDVLSEVLSEFALESEGCSDGASAIDLISENPYDIVFLDIHMPHMNGIETHSRIQNIDSVRPRPYFVAVTADSTPQTKQSCTKSGIDDFITKPISRAKIKRVLSDFQKSRPCP